MMTSAFSFFTSKLRGFLEGSTCITELLRNFLLYSK
jgi:hypothetical protein